MSERVKRGGIAYFALDVPHTGQASYVHITEIVNNLRKLGWPVDVYSPKLARGGVSPPVPVRFFQYAGVIARIVSQLGRYDIVYLRSHYLGWPVAFAARARGRVVVQEVNGTHNDALVTHRWLRPLRSLIVMLYRSQFRVSRHLFPVTGQLAQWLRAEAGHSRITTVPNAANTELFRPMPPRNGKPFVVFFGSLVAWHGIEVMIEAVKHPRWPSEIELLVIGAGAGSSAVETAVKSGATIRWLGFQRYEDIPALAAGALAGLVPITNPQGRSSTGVLPLKLYEMLACGFPVIVSDLPGQADLVRDGGCGLVVPPGDPAALAEAVARLAAEPDKAREMGQRGVDLIRQNHSWESRARAIDVVLRGFIPLSNRPEVEHNPLI